MLSQGCLRTQDNKAEGIVPMVTILSDGPPSALGGCTGQSPSVGGLLLKCWRPGRTPGPPKHCAASFYSE